MIKQCRELTGSALNDDANQFNQNMQMLLNIHEKLLYKVQKQMKHINLENQLLNDSLSK